MIARWLALALVIESAAGFTPWISAVESPPWYLELPSSVYYGWSLLAAVLGILMLLGRKSILTAAVVAMTALQLSGSIPRLRGLDPRIGYTAFFYFNVPAMVLTSLGASLLWRASRALRQAPLEPGARTLGRRAAVLALVGMSCTLLQQAPYLWSVLLSLPDFATSSTSGYGSVMSLLHLTDRLLLLWSAVEMLRIPNVLRMNRVNRMMIGWAIVVTTTLTVSALWYLTFGQGARLVPLHLWAAAVYLTVSLVIVLAPDRSTCNNGPRTGFAI